MGQHEILQIILIPTDDPSFAIVFLLIPIILTSLPDFRLLMSAAELDLLLGGLSTSREGRLSNEDRFGILSMRRTMTRTLIGITMTMNIFLVGCLCQSRPLQRLAQRNHQAGIR